MSVFESSHLPDRVNKSLVLPQSPREASSKAIRWDKGFGLPVANWFHFIWAVAWLIKHELVHRQTVSRNATREFSVIPIGQSGWSWWSNDPTTATMVTRQTDVRKQPRSSHRQCCKVSLYPLVLPLSLPSIEMDLDDRRLDDGWSDDTRSLDISIFDRGRSIDSRARSLVFETCSCIRHN